MIRALCAFVAGAAAAWAALALYGRIPHRQYGETWPTAERAWPEG